MTAPVHLVRLGIDAQKLYGFARRSLAAGARDFDEGYAVHALFAALFDHGAAADARVAPKPFCVNGAGTRQLDVLGYASSTTTRSSSARRPSPTLSPTGSAIWTEWSPGRCRPASRRAPDSASPSASVLFAAWQSEGISARIAPKSTSSSPRAGR